MPHYVRFLKPPHLVRYGPSDSVSALITITTELGDASLAEDVELTFAVRFENALERSLSRTVSWTASSRELRLTLGPFSVPPSAYPATVYVGMMKDANADAVTPELPAILSAWSAPFGGTAGPAAAGLLQRRLGLGNDVLSLWEETGDSISRHVWWVQTPLVSRFAVVLTSTVGTAALFALRSCKRWQLLPATTA